MKLSVVIPVLNQMDMSTSVYKQIRDKTRIEDDDVEFIIVDNGSLPVLDESDFLGAKIIRFDKSIGVYPVFAEGFKHATGDVVAFFHSDLVIWEDGWNLRVMEAFKVNENLGMIGFIGSKEIDSSGGRGAGTTSNFMGRTLLSSKKNIKAFAEISEVITHTDYQMWIGSHAAIHGKVNNGLSKAAVVDGCSMIIHRDAWEDIGVRADFPPHHFYDRLISTQLLEKGWEINVLGIACDHFSGQTVSKEDSYNQMAQKWSELHKPPIVFHEKSVAPNWDATIYQEAERRWLKEYRDKGMVPIRIR